MCLIKDKWASMIRNVMMRHRKSEAEGKKKRRVKGGLIEVEMISVHVCVKRQRAKRGTERNEGGAEGTARHQYVISAHGGDGGLCSQALSDMNELEHLCVCVCVCVYMCVCMPVAVVSLYLLPTVC